MNILKKITRILKRHRLKAKIVKIDKDRDLYKTYFGDLFWLSKDETAWVDKCIKESSIFEEYSTNFIKKIIQNGNIALDIGANIGYYSIMLSRLVGDTGRVLCFEPTNHYRKVLEKNLDINNLKNVEIYQFGLSNKKQELSIDIGDSSASLHNPIKKLVKLSEIINLSRLDDVVEELNITKLDFIKIDVDGHEPAFLDGALETIKKYNPIILLEVNHLNYFDAGVYACDFYDYLVSVGFNIFSEKTLKKYETKEEFLIECGNFSYSANIIIVLDCKNIIIDENFIRL